MVRYFCDACGEEIEDLNTFQYMCHLDSLATGKLDYHVDAEFNAISKRSVVVGLCNKCYNKVAIASVIKLKELQGGE